jgi:hypothetical protein
MRAASHRARSHLVSCRGPRRHVVQCLDCRRAAAWYARGLIRLDVWQGARPNTTCSSRAAEHEVSRSERSDWLPRIGRARLDHIREKRTWWCPARIGGARDHESALLSYRTRTANSPQPPPMRGGHHHASGTTRATRQNTSAQRDLITIAMRRVPSSRTPVPIK